MPYRNRKSKTPRPAFLDTQCIRSNPGSILSSGGSSFLSPPSSESVIGQSPPPRPASQDYFSSGDFRRPQRALSTNVACRSEQEVLDQIHQLKTKASIASNVMARSLHQSENRTKAELTNSLSTESLKSLKLHCSALSKPSTSGSKRDRRRSAALQSLDLIQEADSATLFSSSRRLSRALSWSVPRSSPRTIKTKVELHISLEPNARRGGLPGLCDVEKQTTKKSDRSVPSTIILHKVSATMQREKSSMPVVTMAEDKVSTRDRMSRELSLEFVTFQATTLEQHDQRNGVLFNPKNVRHRQCSSPALPVTTTADVLARASDQISNKQKQAHRGSDSSAPNTRRTSVVQFRSRDSVHEVIWKEHDSNTSGNSQVGGKGILTIEHSKVSSHKRVALTKPRSQERSTPHAQVRNKQSVDENIFCWIRASQPTIGMTVASFESRIKAEDSSLEKDHTLDLGQDNICLNECDTGLSPAMSGRSSVISFPPLRERASTSDWLHPASNYLEPRKITCIGEISKEGKPRHSYQDLRAERIHNSSFDNDGNVRRLGADMNSSDRRPAERLGAGLGSCAHKRILT